MNQNLLSRVLEFLRRKMWNKRWQRAATCLAAVAVFGVTYALILPAVTMTGAHPSVSAETTSGWTGDDLTVQVKAEAEAGLPEKTVVLKLEEDGADLSEDYVFNEEGVCSITDEAGREIELHRFVRDEKKNVIDYWFTLVSGEQTTFSLKLVDKVDPERFAGTIEALRQADEEDGAEDATASNAEKPAAARTPAAAGATGSNAAKASGSNADIAEANAYAKTSEEKIQTETHEDGFVELLDGSVANDREDAADDDEEGTEIVASLKLSAGDGNSYEAAVKDADRNADKRGAKIGFTWKDVSEAKAVNPTLSAKVNGAKIAVFFDGDAEIPAGARLEAEEITEDDPGYVTYLNQAEAAIAQDTDDTQSIAHARFFDITIYGEDDSVIEPKPGVGVRVVITYDEAISIPEEGGLNVVHFSEDVEEPEVLTPGTVEKGQEVGGLAFTTDSFSVYAVVGTEPKTQTFIFMNGADEYMTVILKGDEVLTRPENPEPAQGNEGAEFTGWYTDPACTQEFTQFEQNIVKENGEVRLYAGFVKEITVTYYDSDGEDKDVILSIKVPYNGSCEIDARNPIFDVEEGKANVAWVDADGHRYGENGTETISNMTEDLDLYPVISPRHTIRFRTGEGSSVEDQLLDYDEKVQKPNPDPTRAGYSFAGWYRNADYTGDPYDFDSEVTGDLTLHAKWTPATAKYKLMFYIEHANDDGYDLKIVHEKEGPTETVPVIEDLDKAFADDDFAVKGVLMNDTKLRSYVYEQRKTEQWIADNHVTIKGDGTTTVNVYYRRSRYTVYNHSNNDDLLGELKWGETVPVEWWHEPGLVNQCFYVNTASGIYYRRSAYNERINNSLSSATNNNNSYYGAISDFMNETLDGYKEGHTLTLLEPYVYYTALYTRHGSSPVVGDGSVVTFQAYSMHSECVHFLYKFYETLDSTETEKKYEWEPFAADLTYQTQSQTHPKFNYTETAEWIPVRVYKGTYAGDASVPNFEPVANFTSGVAPARVMAGERFEDYFYDDETGVFCGKHGIFTNYYDVTENGTTHRLTWVFYPVVGFYDRQKYGVEFFTGENAPAISNIDPVFWGTPVKELEDFDTYVRYDGSNLEEATKKTEDGVLYVFTGWYKDAAKVGPEFKFDSDETMPTNTLQLYAKWEPVKLNVTFVSDPGEWTDASDPEREITYGDPVTRPEEDPNPPVDFKFLGWVTEDGHAYSFGSPVTHNITLTAKYASAHTFNITYDLNGGDGTVPVDNRNYLSHSSAVATPCDAVKNTGGERFEFIGWSSDPNSADPEYYPGDTVTILGDITLYAVYGTHYKTTTLTYMYNGGEYGMTFEDGKDRLVEEGIRNNTKLPLDSTPGGNGEDNGFTSTTNCPVPKGYRFEGWATTSNAENPITAAEILVDEDGNNNILYALWSRYETDIHLRKVASSSDAEPAELLGAVFEVLKKNDDGTYTALEDPAYHGLTDTDPVSRITIDGSGTVEKLFDGEYQIKEVKAPDGYIMTGDVISFTITNGVVTDSTQSGMITYNSDEKKFTVGNEPGNPLPHTGGEGTLIYALGGMMLLMMSALMYGFRKRYER